MVRSEYRNAAASGGSSLVRLIAPARRVRSDMSGDEMRGTALRSAVPRTKVGENWSCRRYDPLVNRYGVSVIVALFATPL